MELLRKNKYTAAFIPETTLYRKETLKEFLGRYNTVFVKHDTAGQGRGIFKVYLEENHQLCFRGYSVQGKEVNGSVNSIDDFHRILHPFEKFNRLGAAYIVQEGIASNARNGQPISMRVHVQKLNGKWVVGGMNGKIGTGPSESGIANIHRGAEIFPVNVLLKKQLNLNVLERVTVLRRLKKIAKRAAKVIEYEVPAREYGIDFGLTAAKKPIIFEVNTTPGIGGFATIQDGVQWKRIVDIRKRQKGN